MENYTQHTLSYTVRGKLQATQRELHSERKITRNTQKATQREENYTQHTQSYTVNGKLHTTHTKLHSERKITSNTERATQ